MIVPWREIPPDSLRNMIEEYVTRDGTDYGEQEIPLESRVEQVMAALKQRRLVIWFDEASETLSFFDEQQQAQLNGIE